MPRCVKCQNSGITLKLDFDGYCQSCHSLRIKDYETELATLRSFKKVYDAIPDANDEAIRILKDAEYKAERIKATAKNEADQLIKAARQDAKQIVDNANELNSKADSMFSSAELIKSQAEDSSKMVFADLERRIALLLEESAKDFHFRSRSRAASLYSKSGASSGSCCTFTALTASGFKKRAVKDGYVTFDLETTGLSAKRDRIIEIGAIRFDNQCQEVARFSTLVNPQRKIPAEATKVNGITDDMVKDAPTIDAALADFLSFLGDGVVTLVAHNAPFDMSFLEEALNHQSMPLTAGYADTLAIAKKTFKLSSYSLESLCNHIGYNNKNAHRAVSDADAVDAVLMECIDF